MIENIFLNEERGRRKKEKIIHQNFAKKKSTSEAKYLEKRFMKERLT